MALPGGGAMAAFRPLRQWGQRLMGEIGSIYVSFRRWQADRSTPGKSRPRRELLTPVSVMQPRRARLRDARYPPSASDRVSLDARTLLIVGGFLCWLLAAAIEFQAVRPSSRRVMPDSWTLGLLAKGLGL